MKKLFIILAVMNNYRSSKENVTEQEQTSQSPAGTGEKKQEDEKDEKNTQYYLKRLKIGKSNIAAFVILGGVLIGIQIKRAYDEKQKENLWTARRASYAATAKLAPDVITDDIIVPRSKLAQMVDGIQRICKEYGLQACVVGHIGDGNLHPQIALDMESDDEFKNCMEAKAKMYELVFSLGGALSAEHGIGIEKRAYVEKFLDKYSLEYMKRIKNLFDPTGILNPNKIFKI